MGDHALGFGGSVMSGLTRTEYVRQLAEAHETMVRAGIEPAHNRECNICKTMDHATYRRILGLDKPQEPLHNGDEKA